jgi:hypothetical protein
MQRETGQATRHAFDPVAVAHHETAAWAAYYRHSWVPALRAFVGMISEGFGLDRRQTLRAAYYVLRANQAWAPVPDNDPDEARRQMSLFYRLVADARGLDIDPDEAARLEVDWWREHRILQRERTDDDESALVASLTALYAYVYSVDPAVVATAAYERAAAMRYSDAWVAAGCRSGDGLLDQERRALVRSYSALLDAVT